MFAGQETSDCLLGLLLLHVYVAVWGRLGVGIAVFAQQSVWWARW